MSKVQRIGTKVSFSEPISFLYFHFFFLLDLIPSNFLSNYNDAADLVLVLAVNRPMS